MRKNTLTSTIKSINFDNAITRTSVKVDKRKQSSHHKKGRGAGIQVFLVPNLAIVTYITKTAAPRPSTWLNFELYQLNKHYANELAAWLACSQEQPPIWKQTSKLQVVSESSE